VVAAAAAAQGAAAVAHDYEELLRPGWRVLEVCQIAARQLSEIALQPKHGTEIIDDIARDCPTIW